MPDYSYLKEPAPREDKIREMIAEGFVSPGDAASAREHLLRLSRKPQRAPDFLAHELDVGGDENFDSLTEGDHVEYVEVYFEGEGWQTSGQGDCSYYFLRLWLSDPRDLLPGHFTWV